MISNIIRDYDYLISALRDLVDPMITIGHGDVVDIENLSATPGKSIRFTVTVHGQSEGETMSFVLPESVVISAISKLKVEDIEG